MTKNLDKLKKIAHRLKVVQGGKHVSIDERERLRQKAMEQPRDEHGRFIATDQHWLHSQDQRFDRDEIDPNQEEWQKGEELTIEDIERKLGLKKSNNHSDLAKKISDQAGHQILEHRTVVTPEKPESELKLLAAYKANPHSKRANLLKYLIHRVEKFAEYNTPDGAKKADQDFLNNRDQAIRLAHVHGRDADEQHDLPYMHNFVMQNPHLISGLLSHQQKLHNYIQEKQKRAKTGLSSDQTIKNINGEPHVALFRGLSGGVRKPDPATCSYSDSKQSLGGRCTHHFAHWVPLKNVWYSYDHGPTEAHPNRYFPPQDEYLVSPHDLQTAYGHEVKKIVPEKQKILKRKVASDTAVSFKKVTAGRHPQSPGIDAKPAADPGKPPEKPHVRADSQSVVNFRLEKGLKGDWEKEGYKLSHKQVDRWYDEDRTGIVVYAHTKDGKIAGEYQFSYSNNPKHNIYVTPENVITFEQHRRKGLADAAYNYVQNLTGRIMSSSGGSQSQDAKAFWSGTNTTFNKSLQKSSEKEKEGQFFVDFPKHLANKVKAKGGWATWHFSKKELADILRNWETDAHWEWRGPFARPAKTGKKHPTAIGRSKVTAPIQQFIDEHDGKKVKDVLYHGSGQDKISHDAIKNTVGGAIDAYDPFQDPSDPKDVWKRDIRKLPDKKYDQVHSHYTLNVVNKNGPKQGKEILQEIHDRLNDNGKAVISVRRDDICAEKPKKKLTDLTKSATRSQNLKNNILKLSKADKIKDVADQGIVTQVKPQTGALGVEAQGEKPAPYLRRFSTKPAQEQTPYVVDMHNMDDVQSHKIDNEYWHHVGTRNNHKFHILSRDKNPYSKPLAGIATASHEGKQHIRAAFSNTFKDDHLDLLRTHVNAKPEYEYDGPLVLDSKKHIEPGWEHHHSDMIHGIVPDKTLQAPPSTASTWISFAGVEGDTTPRVVAKEALTNWERRKQPRAGDRHQPGKAGGDFSRRVSYFDAPSFTTAHREGVYSKLANEVFDLGQYVPKTTVFRHPLSNRAWSAMEFIPGAKPVTPETREQDLKEIKDNGDIYKLAIMNVIMGNNDRHMNNILKDAAGKIHLIDHGLTFDYGNQVITAAVPKYIHDKENGYSLLDEDIPESVHQWLWSVDPSKMANAMHQMKVPHDIIMGAVKRLKDARGWSNEVKFGSKHNNETHKGLRYLLAMMRARNFETDDREHGNTVERIKEFMKLGDKEKSMFVGDRNIPKKPPVKTEIKTKKAADEESITDATTIPVDQVKTKVLPSGKATLEHPEDETTKRHPESDIPAHKRRM